MAFINRHADSPASSDDEYELIGTPNAPTKVALTANPLTNEEDLISFEEEAIEQQQQLPADTAGSAETPATAEADSVELAADRAAEEQANWLEQQLSELRPKQNVEVRGANVVEELPKESSEVRTRDIERCRFKDEIAQKDEEIKKWKDLLIKANVEKIHLGQEIIARDVKIRELEEALAAAGDRKDIDHEQVSESISDRAAKAVDEILRSVDAATRFEHETLALNVLMNLLIPLLAIVFPAFKKLYVFVLLAIWNVGMWWILATERKEQTAIVQEHLDTIQEHASVTKPGADSAVPDHLKSRTVTLSKTRGDRQQFGLLRIDTSIRQIRAGGEAQIKGVRVGDQIVAVNGVNVECLSSKAVSEMIREAKGEVTFELRYNPDRLRDLIRQQ